MGQNKEIRRLNSLRGLAALIVVVSHYSDLSGLWGGLLGEGAGQIGVMLFYLLSGFLMSHLYFGLPAESRNLHRYAVARAARVLPLFFAICLGSYAMRHWGPKPYRYIAYRIDTPGVLWSHLLFLHGVSVLWTIPPEIHFYVLFALGWWLFQTRLRKVMPAVVAVALAATLIWGGRPATVQFGPLMVTPLIIQALPLFLIGAMLGRAYHMLDRVARFQHQGFVAAVLAIPLLFPKVTTMLTGRDHTAWGDPLALSAMAVIFFALVFLAPDGNWFLENPVGDFFGRISYSLYLLHLPLLNVLARRHCTTGAGWLLAFIALSTGIAYASFLLIESPSRRFFRRVLRG